jgi:hypothetical protein
LARYARRASVGVTTNTHDFNDGIFRRERTDTWTKYYFVTFSHEQVLYSTGSTFQKISILKTPRFSEEFLIGWTICKPGSVPSSLKL